MRSTVRRGRIGALLLLGVILAIALAGCSKQAEAPAATATAVPEAGGELVWPDDEAIAYCPVFEGGEISRVTRPEANQMKSYIISFDKVEQEAYDAYAKTLEDDEGITVVTNYNTRGTSYALHAYKTGDEAMAIRITYTKPTQKMQINVTYEP
ncbi:MAG: hypothetical protein LBS11_06035 [Oscillospiraceae bacterium]|nr:hypothetical protein [Oscillospiraceae bacterium]